MLNLLKRSLTILFRIVLILCMFFAFNYAKDLSETFSLLVHYLVYISLLGLLILSTWFRQHKILLFVFLLVFLKVPLDFIAISSGKIAIDHTVIIQGIVLLLPPNLLLLASLSKNQIRPVGRFFLTNFFLIQTFSLFWLAQARLRGIVDPSAVGLLPSTTRIELGFLQQEWALIFFLCASVAIINELVFLDAFKRLMGTTVITAVIYSYLALNLGLDVDALFLIVSLFIVIHILKENYQAAYLDQLTGIPGRRALFEQGNQLGGEYVVAMVDIDFFKRFNDRYGHDLGDDVLAYIASILSKTAEGPVFRYGGEEFTILLTKTNLEDALKHLDQVRKTVAESKFRIRRGTGKKGAAKTTAVNITVSMGVAAHSERESLNEVIKSADKALYRAKSKGRNCVSK